MEALVTLLGWLRCCLEGFPDKRRRNNTQYSKVDIGMSALSESIGGEEMRKSNFALRLKPSLLVEARKVAESEGVALNQFINVAVAEKVSALRTESYFAERAARADIPRALGILSRAGKGKAPVKGDELPD